MDIQPMSPAGEPDHVARLRAVITRIERGTTPAAASSGVTPKASVFPLGQTGFGLDLFLGGGLRRGTLHEIAPASARDEGTAARFAVGVAACGLRIHRAVVWIVDDCAWSESGAPYRPGLQGEGLDPDRLIMVRTRGGAQTLWAAEEALRGSGALVLVELWAGKGYGLDPSRRLLLAARLKGATALLLHAGLGAATRALSTSCDTRMVISAHPSHHLPCTVGTLPVPGPPAFGLRLAKARSATRPLDPDALFPLHWNAAQRCFHDPDHSVAVASPLADRPPRPAGSPTRSGASASAAVPWNDGGRRPVAH